MIHAEDLKAVGKFLKPHGINGEINLSRDFDDLDFDDFRCVVVELDGIFVPFFLSNVREKSADIDLVTIDGVEDEKHASRLTNKVVYVLRDELDALRRQARADVLEEGEEDAGEDGFFADDLVGYTAFDGDKELGEIVSVDDSTANYLFVIQTPAGASLFIPVAGDFITEVDEQARKVVFELPDGMLDMQM